MVLKRSLSTAIISLGKLVSHAQHQYYALRRVTNSFYPLANELKRAWGTHFVVSETDNENYEQYFGNMVAIALPIPKFSTVCTI